MSIGNPISAAFPGALLSGLSRFICLCGIVCLLINPGCDRSSVGYHPDGDDGEKPTADGDQPPADGDGYGEEERDADCDAEPDQDAEYDIESDGEEHSDDDLLIDGIFVNLTNVGDLAAYVNYSGPLWPGRLGIEISDQDHRKLRTALGCMPLCDGLCEPIGCGAPLPRVLQILPGEELEYVWDGAVYEPGTCESGSAGTIDCVTETRAPGGQYYLKLVYSPLLSVDETNVRRLPGDIIAPAGISGEPSHAEYPIYLEEGRHQVQETFFCTLGEEKKPWAYCGQAWTFSAHIPWRYNETDLDIREGSSIVIPVAAELDTTEAQCIRPGSMIGWVNDSLNEINLMYGSFYGQKWCDMEDWRSRFAYIFPPQAPGEWKAFLNNGFSTTTMETSFTVGECPECLLCGNQESAGLGNACDADCNCASETAVCLGSEVCEIPCLTNRDCPPETHCSALESGPISFRTCLLQTENECSGIWNCPPGHYCDDQNPGGYSRCMPDLDTRALEEMSGMGLHCGCDVECPGAQSCVKFDFNFTDGFCALRCRDSRDCPENWRCVEMTCSGLQAMCMPSPY